MFSFFCFFHARLFLAECPLQAVDTTPPALSLKTLLHGRTFPGGAARHYLSNMYREVIAIIYVGEETGANGTVFLGLYFMFFFFFLFLS